MALPSPLGLGGRTTLLKRLPFVDARDGGNGFVWMALVLVAIAVSAHRAVLLLHWYRVIALSAIELAGQDGAGQSHQTNRTASEYST